MELARAATLEATGGDRAAFARALRTILAGGGGDTAPPLFDAEANQPAWGVEYRVVPQGKRLLVPLITFPPETQTVRLDLPAAGGAAVDRLSGQTVDPRRIILSPLEPRLVEIEVTP